MPRNSAGNYALPLPPVVPGATIVASFENTTDSDIATELTNSLDRNGRGGMLAPFKIADGTVSAPGMSFTLDPDNGIYRYGNDQWALAVGGAQLIDLTVGRIGIGGALVTTGAATFGGTVTAQGALTVAGNATLNGGATLTGPIGVTGNLTVSGTITAGDGFFHDVTADRGNGTGAHFFASGQARYIFYDGAKYVFKVAPLDVESSVGIATAGTLIQNPLQVRVAANQQFIVTAAGSLPLISAVDNLNNLINPSLYGATAVVPTFDNGITFGDATHRWTALWAVNGTVQTSDARLKKNVQDSVLGLAFINGLRPVSYQWINGGNVTVQKPVGEEEVPGHTTIDGVVVPPSTRVVYELGVVPTEGTATHFGLIAQEVRQAVVAVGVEIKTFGGFVQIDPSNTESELGLNYTEFIAPLIKAVQELSARLTLVEGKPA